MTSTAWTAGTRGLGGSMPAQHPLQWRHPPMHPLRLAASVGRSIASTPATPATYLAAACPARRSTSIPIPCFNRSIMDGVVLKLLQNLAEGADVSPAQLNTVIEEVRERDTSG